MTRDEYMETPYLELGKYLQNALKETKRSASWLAQQIGIDRSHLSRVLKGNKRLSKEKLELTSAVTNISLAELLRLAHYQRASDTHLRCEDVEVRRAGDPVELDIVTDLSFIDSALFYWLFNTQPLASVGVTFSIVHWPWDNVLEEIKTRDKAIGFANRREAVRQANDVTIWSDLCLYTGYSLLVRKSIWLQERPANAREAVARLKIIAEERENATILCIGGDTEIQFQDNPLLKGCLNGYRFKHFGSAEAAFREFRKGEGDAFVGGLPQRLIAAEDSDVDAIEVINYANNPLLFALNSLVVTPTVAVEYREVLGIITNLWFETINKMRSDREYCEIVVEEMLNLVEQELGTKPTIVELGAPRICDIVAASQYEFFPCSQGELFGELTNIFVRTEITLRESEDGDADDDDDEFNVNPSTVFSYLNRNLGVVEHSEEDK